MKRKQKGLNAERELIHFFWEAGWAANRIAGSGSTKYPSPDVIAGNAIRRIAIECKATKENSKYLTKEEVLNLKKYSEIFGAEAWIAVRFNGAKWYFLPANELGETNKHYNLSMEICQRKGFIFDEMTGVKPVQRLVCKLVL